MKNHYVLLLILPFLSACSAPKNELLEEAFQPLVRLAESTTIIRELISSKQLGKVLEPHTAEQMELLINNFSPAELAFEAEVFTTTTPLIAVYYYEDNAHEQAFIHELEALALEYDDKVKFVVVDIDALFSLAQDADIEKAPTLILARNRDILERRDGNITIDLIRSLLHAYF
jgi:thioredoxin-like negative regulator of GroEL